MELRNKSKTTVSIITVCYNAQDVIEKTILSVINQTYQNLEYIIIDGNSNDNTTKIIKKYDDKITYWCSEPDKGIYDAMNKGILKTKGEWIIFMNAGDCFSNNYCLEKVFSKHIEDNIYMIYGDINYLKNGEIKHIKALPANKINHRMPCSHQAMFLRKSFNDILFNLNYTIAAEYEIIHRILKASGEKSFLYLPITICDFDGNDGISSLYPLKCFKECIDIRAYNKDLYWYWDYTKYLIKKFVLSYK